VWGLSDDVMAKLTVINQITLQSARKNNVTVMAGDNDSGMAVCFDGTIGEAWGDYHAQPDVAFHLTAYAGRVDAIRPIPPTTFDGGADVGTVLAGICAQMQPPRTLENNGVAVKLYDPYMPGTAIDQIRAIARHANINAVLDDNNVLAIWPLGGSRGSSTPGGAASSGALIPVISPDTGMVGYPDFTQNSVRIRTLYNPSLSIGQTVDVRSDIKAASGQLVIASMSHSLEAQLSGGAWFTSIECGVKGLEAPIVN
jgi:hypothetical protein